jgi:hypothetical protein
MFRAIYRRVEEGSFLGMGSVGAGGKRSLGVSLREGSLVEAKGHYG